MSTETYVIAAIVACGIWGVTSLVRTFRTQRYGPRRRRHSFTYRWYIEKNSRLWRTRKFLWYWTSDHRCEKCRCHVRLHSRNYTDRAEYDHKNYKHLLFERRGRDIQQLCSPCHRRKHSWMYRR